MKRKTDSYAAGIFIKENSILLVRELGSDDFPKEPYHLPGGKLRSKDGKEVSLKKSIERKYGTDIRVSASISPVAVFNRDGSLTVLYGFVCQPLGQFAFPRAHFAYRYVKFEELDDYYIDPADKALAKKVAIFMPLYLAKRRTNPLTDKEKGEIGVYMDCLYYFGKTIPAVELSDFSLLIRYESSMATIRKAFRFIMDAYGCDYAQFLDVRDYQDKHR